MRCPALQGNNLKEESYGNERSDQQSLGQRREDARQRSGPVPTGPLRQSDVPTLAWQEFRHGLGC